MRVWAVVHWGPAFALFATLYIYIAALFQLPHSTASLTANPLVDVIFLTLMEARVLVCFFAAMWKEPGYVEADWADHIEDASHLRVCQICQVLQPPRAHHCRQCGHCVRKMDHHCPWINNCVGHENERAFLFFVTSASSICFVMFIWFLVKALTDSSIGFVCVIKCLVPVHRTKRSEEAFAECQCLTALCVYTALFLSLLVSISTGWLAFEFCRSISRNTTLIEEWILGDYKKLTKMKNLRNPYDLGTLANWTQFLGPSVLTWLVPVFKHESGGVNWPIREGMAKYCLEDMRKELLEKKNALQNVSSPSNKELPTTPDLSRSSLPCEPICQPEGEGNKKVQ